MGKSDQPVDGEESTTTQLVRRAQSGDREAFETWVNRHGSRLMRFVRRRMGVGLRGYVETEDVVQEGVLDAWRHLPSYRRRVRHSFARWVNALLVNRVLRMASDRQRDRMEPLGPAQEGLEAAGGDTTRLFPLDLERERQLLTEARATLSPCQREAVRLRLDEGLSFREIGERLERSEAAATMLFTRAKAELARRMSLLRRPSRAGAAVEEP